MDKETREQLEAIASGELSIDFPARWTNDCQGKQDLDCCLISLSTRYYPDHTSYPSIYLGGLQVARAKFEDCRTEGEAKHKAEQWAQTIFDRINRAVAIELLKAENQQGKDKEQ